VLVFAYAMESSGVPPEWAAGAKRAGVNYLDDLSARSVERIAAEVGAAKRHGDVVVASIHWGGNWGYAVPSAQRSFAHALIDAGVDVVHGHSSHHPRGIEVYRDRLVLYGCGDFLNDYEGISGHEDFRPDLTLMYLPALDAASGRLVQLRLVPMQIRHFRANRVRPDDARWLAEMLTREGHAFGTRAVQQLDGTLAVSWGD
jgi:poly-gamma-glutamate synthesis protein (capsule biosynthesis protein)